MFILLTPRKVTELPIYKASNYPDLLPEMPRYCCLVEIFFILFFFWVNKDMTEI